MAKAIAKSAVAAPPALTQRQLEQILGQLRGATFVTLLTRTEPSMNKGGNPFHGKVFKISRVNGVANFKYANSVNRQRGREGKVEDFRPEPRKWGQRVEGTPLVFHKGQTYLELKVERSLGHSYVWANGDVMSDEEVEQLKSHLRKRKQPETQGTDKEIILRDYKLSNIIAITMNGQQSIVVPL